MPSLPRLAKRAVVTCLLAVATACSASLELSRDTDDEAVRAAYAKVLRQAQLRHQDTKQLKAKKVAWEKVLAQAHGAQPGRRTLVAQDFRIRATAVLLTYQSFLDVLQWHRLCGYIQEHILEWQVKHWCVTLERCEYGRLHAHVMLQFVREQDRTSRSFTLKASHQMPSSVFGPVLT